MSLMTPEEIRKKVPKGLYVKNKCDSPLCGRPIMSSFIIAGTRGEYCSKACYEAGEGFDRSGESDPKSNSDSNDDIAQTNHHKKTSKTTKEKKDVKESDDDAPKKRKKKKHHADADDDSATKKKLKKKKRDDDSDANDDKPKKKKGKKVKSADGKKKAAQVVKGDGKNPYARPSSAAYQVFEMAKKGTTKKAINKFLEENQISPARIWKELKAGKFKDSGIFWRYVEDGSSVTVKLKKAEK